MKTIPKRLAKSLLFCLVISGLLFGPTGTVSAVNYTCNSCASCTTCLTGGDCNPATAGNQVIAPGDNVILSGNVGPGAVPPTPLNGRGNCVDWGAVASGGARGVVTLDCRGFSVIGGAAGNGIRMTGVSQAVVQNCKVRNFGLNGIHLADSDENEVSSNTITGNAADGVHLADSRSNNVFSNTITVNNANGVHLVDSNLNQILTNTITSNDEDGIRLRNSTLNHMKGNSLTGNGAHGILLLKFSSNNSMWNNGVSDNALHGILIVEADWNAIEFVNRIQNNGLEGIRLEHCQDTTIQNNEISDNGRHGVELLQSGNNHIFGANSIRKNQSDGVKLSESLDNRIEGNEITENGRHGVHFFDSPNNRIDANVIRNNGQHGVFDHPIQWLGPALGAQAPGGANGVAPNGVPCDPWPATPWQNTKPIIGVGNQPFWCLGVSGFQDGGDPPIYENILAFPTPERSMGQDLNGDGDTNDTVLRYMNLETGEVVNTGLIAFGTHHAMDIYENVIVFVGGGSRIRYYDINTGTVGDTGANGSRPSIYRNTIAFASGGTIRYFDLNSETLVDTKAPGSSPAVYQDLIVFHLHGTPTAPPRAAVGSPAIYQDLIVFDASSPQSATGTYKLWTYDLRTGAVADTGIVGRDATVYENVVAFVTPESSVAEDLNGDGDTNDLVIRYYDLAKQTVVNTGAVGRYPALYGSRIVFATRERAVNQDLNGDGMIASYVIRYYDLETGQVVNTHKLGTEPDIYDDTITFYLWEDWVALDLNGDGDQGDPILGSFTVFDNIPQSCSLRQ
jgi:parallel beta-helix repeat protein